MLGVYRENFSSCFLNMILNRALGSNKDEIAGSGGRRMNWISRTTTVSSMDSNHFLI